MISIRSTSLSTIIGDQIEKFSQPANPIYRIEYFVEILYDEDDTLLRHFKTLYGSVIGELMPLTDEDIEEKKRFEKWRDRKRVVIRKRSQSKSYIYNEATGKRMEWNIKATDEWEDRVCYNNSEEDKTEKDYWNMLKFKGKLHLKLFKHIQRSLEKPIREPEWCDTECCVLVKMERLG